MLPGPYSAHPIPYQPNTASTSCNIYQLRTSQKTHNVVSKPSTTLPTEHIPHLSTLNLPPPEYDSRPVVGVPNAPILYDARPALVVPALELDPASRPSEWFTKGEVSRTGGGMQNCTFSSLLLCCNVTSL